MMKYITLLVCQLLFCVILTSCFMPPKLPASNRTVVSSTLPVNLVWSLNLDSRVTQTPLITDQWVAIVTERSLYLFDVASGKLQWHQKNASSHPIPMVAEGDSLIIGEFGGVVSSLDFATGELQWQKQINDSAHSFINSVIVVDDLIVAVSQPTEVKALSLVDGSIQWEISARTTQILDRAVHAASYNDKVYVLDIKTYIVDAASGHLEHVVNLDINEMQFTDRYLFDQHSVYDPETFVYRFGLGAPNQNSQSEFCNGLRLPYAVKSETVFAAGKCGGIYAISLVDGKVLWEYMPKVETSSPVAVLGDVLYVLMLNGEIHAITADGGRNVGILATSAPLADHAVGDLTSLGIVTNGKVLVVTFNEPTVLGLGLPPK